jgi:hypothetical protein
MPIERTVRRRVLASLSGSIAAAAFAAGIWFAPSSPPHVEAVTPTPTPTGARLALDLDINNGLAPCDVIDPTATAVTGTQVKVAVCVDNLPPPTGNPALSFQYRVRYDDGLIVAPEIANSGSGLTITPTRMADQRRLAQAVWDLPQIASRAVSSIRLEIGTSAQALITAKLTPAPATVTGVRWGPLESLG